MKSDCCNASIYYNCMIVPEGEKLEDNLAKSMICESCQKPCSIRIVFHPILP